MNALLTSVLELLPQYGPWLLFVMATLETCFVTGLVVPSGLATSAATVLALQGELQLPAVVVAAVCGGALGDTIGFWIGRAWGERVLAPDGRFAKRFARAHAIADELFERHPVYSVTVGRLISFVRTVMPMAAGMSDLPYRRYLPYEIAGLLGWAAIYVGIGVFARESWELATQVVGVGGTLAFGAVAVAGWIAWRRRGGSGPVPLPGGEG